MRTAPPAALVVSLAALLAGAPGAVAQTTTCDGQMSGHIQGPLDVPAGNGCELATNTIVEGATTVEGSLDAPVGVSFGGDVTATNPTGGITIDKSTVEGALTVTGATSGVELEGDTIEGAANIDSNHADVSIGGNTFTSSLACTGNDPAPHDEAASTIEGGASGQCAGFGGPGGGSPSVKPIKLPKHPYLHRGELVVPLQCTVIFCAQLVRVTVTDHGHRLHLGGRHANLADSARTTWKFRLSRSWQSRLHHHPGHVVVTVAGVTVFSGSV